MPNHVHLPIVPAWRAADGRGRVAGDLWRSARRYTGAINARFRWTGHLVQGRFGAVVMDERHLLAAARYIALNPAVAGLVSRAENWPWCSTRAQLAGVNDELGTVAPLRALLPILRHFSPCRLTRRRRPGSSGLPPSAARWAARNGSRCSSAGSAAL